MEYLLMQYV